MFYAKATHCYKLKFIELMLPYDCVENRVVVHENKKETNFILLQKGI
jgi:hypothetical protein